MNTLQSICEMNDDRLRLAYLIRDQIDIGRSEMEVAKAGRQIGASSQWARGDALVTQATILAIEFAKGCGKDGPAFLEACKINKAE